VGDNRSVRGDVIALTLPEPALSDGGVALRAWEDEDVLVVLAAGVDELISRYRYSLPRTADAARSWIAATETQRLVGERLELAITEHGTPVGSVSLAEIAGGWRLSRRALTVGLRTRLGPPLLLNASVWAIKPTLVLDANDVLAKIKPSSLRASLMPNPDARLTRPPNGHVIHRSRIWGIFAWKDLNPCSASRDLHAIEVAARGDNACPTKAPHAARDGRTRAQKDAAHPSGFGDRRGRLSLTAHVALAAGLRLDCAPILRGMTHTPNCRIRQRRRKPPQAARR
jgi:hypothetical protein